jgi:hypothetical protein
MMRIAGAALAIALLTSTAAVAQTPPPCPDCGLFGQNSSGSYSCSGDNCGEFGIFGSINVGEMIISRAMAQNTVGFNNPGFPPVPNGYYNQPGSNVFSSAYPSGSALVNPGILFNLPTLSNHFNFVVPYAPKPINLPPNAVEGYPNIQPLLSTNDHLGGSSLSIHMVSDQTLTRPFDLVVEISNPDTHQVQNFTFPGIVNSTPYEQQLIMVSVYTQAGNTFIGQAGVFPKGQVPLFAHVQTLIGTPGIAFLIPFTSTIAGPLHYSIGKDLVPSASPSPITGEYTYTEKAGLQGSGYYGSDTLSGNLGTLFFNAAGLPQPISSFFPPGPFMTPNGLFVPLPTGPNASANLQYPGQPAANIFLAGPAVPNVDAGYPYGYNNGYIAGLGDTGFAQAEAALPSSGPTVTIESIDLVGPTDAAGDFYGP